MLSYLILSCFPKVSLVYVCRIALKNTNNNNNPPDCRFLDFQDLAFSLLPPLQFLLEVKNSQIELVTYGPGKKETLLRLRRFIISNQSLFVLFLLHISLIADFSFAAPFSSEGNNGHSVGNSLGIWFCFTVFLLSISYLLSLSLCFLYL